MTSHDALAHEYDAGRIGYAADLYDLIVEYGVGSNAKILDVACGTGLASRPFIENGYDVTGVDDSQGMLDVARRRLPEATWVRGRAEALPFDDASFDVTLSAQALHTFDREAALREMVRVLRPNGIVALWWKQLLSDDPFARLRDDVARELGVEPPAEGLTGGFKEFYGAPLADHTLRIIPWRIAIGVEQLLAGERSRSRLRDALKAKTTLYLEVLQERLRKRYGEGNPLVTLAYLHYLYLGRT